MLLKTVLFCFLALSEKQYSNFSAAFLTNKRISFCRLSFHLQTAIIFERFSRFAKSNLTKPCLLRFHIFSRRLVLSVFISKHRRIAARNNVSAQTLPILSAMKLSDFLIIYLSCGAPFGVFYFLQQREEKDTLSVSLKSVALIFVWIPYALRLLRDFAAMRFWRNNEKISVDQKQENLQKQIAQILFDSDAKISLFELREVFERYAGLTLARNSADLSAPATDAEIFRIALRQNINLGAKCLHRRNISRIELHQKAARQDFLRLVSELSGATSETKKLCFLAIKFTNALNDFDATNALNEMFEFLPQNEGETSVQDTEKELWTADKHKRSTANRISFRPGKVITAGKD